MINFHKKNKIEIANQRILKAEVRKDPNGDVFRFSMPRAWGKALELTRDDRDLLITLTKDNEIIIRKALPEDY